MICIIVIIYFVKCFPQLGSIGLCFLPTSLMAMLPQTFTLSVPEHAAAMNLVIFSPKWKKMT